MGKLLDVPLLQFLLVYDRAAQHLIARAEFEDLDEAERAYEAAERTHRHDPNIEVVLIGADSIETVEQTHGNYFRSRGLRDVVGAAVAV